MENLRWILLLAGIVFVVIVYLLSRRRSRAGTQTIIHPQDDLPEFSATDTAYDDLGAVDEGVGKVRIIANYDDIEPSSANTDTEVGASDAYESDAEAIPESSPESSAEAPGDIDAGRATTASKPSDLISLYVLSSQRDEMFGGDQINSAARASGLVFGDMNIFHRFDEDGLTTFSMANMLKPGSFDPDAMHETETSGITLFMQASMVEQPSEVLDDMLHTAYQMSEMLGGRLCNQHRKPLTEQDANNYRQIAADN